ncbi:actin cytoskeleton-regulatory complex protein PAN1-like [Quercus robur]|uniref:actin cytoskeleton-regulatory complex protein PAN1-like n=1 Tax=Quercus robur TaxID=38942 RepID=UPI0021628342|nr:actin cytoskeleton-regulatory complex protein PAN1-like [Quercus robur]
MSPRTNINLLTAFANKGRTTSRLSLVNIPALNYLLRSEIFVSEDEQLRSAPLILDYTPLTRAQVEAGQAIRAGSPRLARIDVSIPGFLADTDLPPIQLPPQRVFPPVVIPEEEAGSSHSSLEDQIDQFQFTEEGEASVRVVEISDSDADLDRASAAAGTGLVIAQPDLSEDTEEEEGMDLQPRTGLRGLLSNRSKGQTSKEVSKGQTVPKAPAPPPPPSSGAALKPMPNLRRKRLVEETEEGEVTQQIYVAEEWAKKAREDMHREAQSRTAAERVAGDLKRDLDRQDNELKEVRKANANAEAGLKNAEKQADELRKQLRHSEERLSAEQQAVSELKAELARAKEEARLSREVAEKAVAASYERGVHDTEERLAEEVATVCREYVTSTWGLAMDRAAVPADSDLRKTENIFFPAEIREIPGEVASIELLPADSSIPETGGTEQATQGQSPEDSLRISEILAQAQEIAPENPATDDQPASTQGP